MAITLEGFNKWVSRGKTDGRKYMISVCDTFDYDDYPVYCDTLEEVRGHAKTCTFENMQRINEVIDLATGDAINWRKEL